MSSSNKTTKKKTHSLPRTGTGAARDFFDSWGRINHFLNFILHLVGHTDSAAENAHKVLVETARDSKEKARLKKNWEKRIPATKTLKSQRQFFLEVLLVRHIENYLNYLSALLFEIFTQRPETLRSSDKVELVNVLQHETIESLIRAIAERKVESLSYSSYQELAHFFEDRFDLVIVPEADVPVIIETIEIRNISVHNRCVVNKRFISRTGCPESLLGKRKELFLHDLDELVPNLAECVRNLDRNARKKLKLKGRRFSAEGGR